MSEYDGINFLTLYGGTVMFRTLFRGLNAPAHGLNVKSTTAPELHKRMQAGEELLLLDVRTSQEYAYDGHVAGSRLLPLNMLMQRSGELPKEATIICICRSGNRSQAACEQLAAMGFDDVTNLTGGMFGWRRAGLPME